MTNFRQTIFAPLPRPAKAALLATTACMVATGAMAQGQNSNQGAGAPLTLRNSSLGYALSVGPTVTYTDNISLSPSGFRDDELAIGVNTDGSAIYTTNRFTGLISGTLDVSYLTDQAEVVASQNVGAAGTATIKDNWLYFDVAGSTRRQLAGDNARYSQNVNAGRSQRVNVHNFSLSPYMNHRFANGSAAELRYRFSQVFIGDTSNANASSLGLNFNKDSRTQEVIASYDTNTLYDRLKVGITAYGNRTEEYGSSVVPDYEFEQGSISSDVQIAVSPRFAITGVVGYDEVDTTAPANFISGDDLTGINWRAGFRAQPGRKTNVRIEYGRRYGDDFVTANLGYNVTSRISFNASANRTVQTRAQAVSSSYEATQRKTLDFADRLRDGGVGDANEVINHLARISRTRIDANTIGIGVSNRINANLFGAFGRTTVGANASYADTDYGFRQIETYGGGFNVNRQISRRTSVYANTFYRHVDSTFDATFCETSPTVFGLDPTLPGFDPVIACAAQSSLNNVSDTVSGRIGLSRRIFKNLSAYGQYAHTRRFSENPGLKYNENALTAGVQMDF